MAEDYIPGGYILLARKMFDSWLMDKPPLYWKMWVWMIGQANWKDRGQLKKGQFITSTKEMQEAMSYMVGYRKKTPTRAEIRSSYEAFTNNHMIDHTKSTRGIVVTIENFSKYQDFKSYEQPSEQPNVNTTNNQVATQDTEGIRKQESKKAIPYAEIVGYLNEKTGKKYKQSSDATRKLIRGRLADGFVFDDFKAVIDNMTAEWLEDREMGKYLRPETIFGASKFEGYLNREPKTTTKTITLTPKQQQEEDEWNLALSRT